LLDWLAYAGALALGAAIGWGAWHFLVGGRRPTPPIPIEPDDPELTCTLVPIATAQAAIGDRTLWFAEGPTKGQSALIYPFGDLRLLLNIDHPDESTRADVLRFLARARADYVLLHPVSYAPLGIALRPHPDDERRQITREQLAELASRAGLQVVWLPNTTNGDIDDAVRVVADGALAPPSHAFVHQVA
jgi:hypothetical protein